MAELPGGIMTDLVKYEPGAERNPAADLIAWASAAQQAYQIAQRLAETSFVPKIMQRRPDEITGCILAGRELGLHPMAALRSIDVIDGTPAMRAMALRGLVQAHGHEIWVEESTDHRAIVCGKRRTSLIGGGGHVERSTWTIDRAKKAGLAGKKNWLNHPAAMLVARATAQVCRLIAADVLLGMPYASEELADDIEPEEAAESRPAPKRRTVQRAPLTPVEDLPLEPDSEPEPDAEASEKWAIAALEDAGFEVAPIEVVELPEEDQEWPPLASVPQPPPPDEPMVSKEQMARLQAGFRGAGILDRDERLKFAANLVGRPLASSSDLTKREASRVIDALIAAFPPRRPDGAA